MSVKAWAKQFNDLEPITEEQKRFHARQSAEYIIVNNKEGDCTCPKCGKQLRLGKTKHKSEFVCPECSSKLIIQHAWRASKRLETINWMAIPKVINPHVLCLRYVLAYQNATSTMAVYEAARMFISDKYVDPEFYCLGTHGWSRGRSPYFRTDTYMTPNRFWCRYADPYMPGFFEEIDKLECFKYYSSRNEYDETCIVTQLIYMIHAAKLNEKLAKVGMKNMVDDHREYFCNHGDRCYPANYKANSLKEMLGLDKPKFALLKKFPSWSFWIYLKSHSNVNTGQLEAAKGDVNRYEYVRGTLNKIGVSFNKLNAYLDNVSVAEHRHYLDTLERLGYDLKSTYYTLPKNFAEADERVTDEYMQRFDARAYKARQKNDRLIKKISDGLRKMDGLKEFLNGSKGLLVYVPESTKELQAEGRRMNNCIGSYSDRIAEGKTLVFFVRKMDNPTASYVAFEYHNGEVIQCRYDHNRNVVDTEIINFVDAFSNVLRENKVLCA